MEAEKRRDTSRRKRISRRLKGAGYRVVDWDKRLSARLTLSQRARLRRKGAILGAHLGDSLVWLALGLAALVLGNATVRQVVIVTALAVILSAGSVTIVKPFLRRQRPRPDMKGFFWDRFDRYSFPSGHAARTASIAIVMGINYPHYAPSFFLLPFIVGLCRIALGIHYLSDILVGLIIGFVFAWVVISIL